MLLKIGVIGVGTIAVAFIKGMLGTCGKEVSVYLSPRNRENAQALAAAYDNVQVMRSNQEVLDHSEWVILCVIPQIAPQVLGELSFRENHKVVSFITAFRLEELNGLVGKTAILTRMVPLPFIEYRVGPLAVYPQTDEVAEKFACLGDLIAADNEQALGTLISITALMSPFYAVLGEVVAWGEKNGLANELSARYAISFFQALLLKAKHLPPAVVAELWREMTPGGLNEMAVTSMREEKGFAIWADALDRVMKRIMLP